MATPLEYATLPTGRRTAARVRGAILAAGVIFTLLGLMFVYWPPLFATFGLPELVGLFGTPFAPVNYVSDRPVWYAIADPDFGPRYWALGTVYLGVVLLGQWVLLCPAGSWRPRVSPDAKPAKFAALGGAFVATLLSIGLLATILEVGGHWSRLSTHDVIRGTGYPEVVQDFRALWVVMAVVWMFWTTILAGYFRTVDHRTAVSKVLRWVLAGSVLNVLAAAPVQATKSGDCYCARGSYTGLVFGLTAALWLFGPAVLLLYYRELRRASH